MKVVIIAGSSRSDGDTAKVAGHLADSAGWDLVDLNDYSFSYYDYQYRNKDDDYLPVMQKIILNYDVIVLVSPVYWYAMSGIMKVFLDRITGLLDHEKELGRKLRGKKMAALSVSIGDHLGEYYWLPFKETARYLGMSFITGVHTLAGHENKEILRQFSITIKNST
jgi:multimeric flavodoxin WrbA